MSGLCRFAHRPAIISRETTCESLGKFSLIDAIFRAKTDSKTDIEFQRYGLPSRSATQHLELDLYQGYNLVHRSAAAVDTAPEPFEEWCFALHATRMLMRSSCGTVACR